ncbi:MAG: hypothetical protein RLZZ618_3992, partial [Pseudomonadota bacterium]
MSGPQVSAPSLFDEHARVKEASPLVRPAEGPTATLLDLMYDGFYLLFLLRAKNPPTDAAEFRQNISSFLAEFEQEATRRHKSADEVHQAKYALCALLDEVILQSNFKVRDDWESRPLQLEYFGEQLAGENFFIRLEKLRVNASANREVLEIFHMCLLLGFQGKYLIEGTERLGYLTLKLGEEVASLKGKRAAFSPNWQAPDRVIHALRHEVPVWVIASVFGLLGLVAFVSMQWSLRSSTEADLAG